MAALDLDMGPYGAYVWPAFALSGVVLAGLVLDSLARSRRWRREVERLMGQDAAGPDSFNRA